MLHELKNWRCTLNDVDLVPELQNVIHQIDELQSTIEKRSAKLKPALAIREQFNELTSDISLFISKYTEVVREIERPGFTTLDKIKKYEEVRLFSTHSLGALCFLDCPITASRVSGHHQNTGMRSKTSFGI